MQNVRVMPRSANETSFLQSYGWHAISTHFSLHEPISLNLQNVLQCALTNQHILAFNWELKSLFANAILQFGNQGVVRKDDRIVVQLISIYL